VGVFSWQHWSPLFRRTGTPRNRGWVIPHAAVNLLPEPSAYTNTREHGTPTPETDLQAATSSPWARGMKYQVEQARLATLPRHRRASKRIARIWSGSFGAGLTTGRTPPESVGSDE
jgi:hypothetical protein